MNKLRGKPLFVISSTKRNDCVSHRMDNKEKVTSKKPTNICFAIYMFSFFMLLEAYLYKLLWIITKIYYKKTNIFKIFIFYFLFCLFDVIMDKNNRNGEA